VPLFFFFSFVPCPDRPFYRFALGSRDHPLPRASPWFFGNVCVFGSPRPPAFFVSWQGQSYGNSLFPKTFGSPPFHVLFFRPRQLDSRNLSLIWGPPQSLHVLRAPSSAGRWLHRLPPQLDCGGYQFPHFLQPLPPRGGELRRPKTDSPRPTFHRVSTSRHAPLVGWCWSESGFPVLLIWLFLSPFLFLCPPPLNSVGKVLFFPLLRLALTPTSLPFVFFHQQRGRLVPPPSIFRPHALRRSPPPCFSRPVPCPVSGTPKAGLRPLYLPVELGALVSNSSSASLPTPPRGGAFFFFLSPSMVPTLKRGVVTPPYSFFFPRFHLLAHFWVGRAAGMTNRLFFFLFPLHIPRFTFPGYFEDLVPLVPL